MGKKCVLTILHTCGCAWLALICNVFTVPIASAQTTADVTLYYVTYADQSGVVFQGTQSENYFDGLPVEWGGVKPRTRTLSSSGNTELFTPAALEMLNESYYDTANSDSGRLAGPFSVYRRNLYGSLGGPCIKNIWYTAPTKIFAGLSASFTTTVLGLPLINPADRCRGSLLNPGQWPVNDRLAFGAPIRRTTISGHEYEAAPMVMQRNGVPWMTYYFAYRIGIAGGESNWVESSRSAFAADFPKFPSSAENFELTTLPPPIIEGEVVEFVNAKVSPASVGGHYFYASSAEDKAALDASDDWIRTGRQFKSGGYVPVCRFLYKAPGSSTGTHFFTAKADECAQFKTMPGFTYEGTPFRASLPAAPVANVAADDPTRCPPKTVPLYRFFNNPAAGSYLPNHRYLTNRAAGQVTGYAGPGKPAQTWADEGIALCVAG